MVFGGYYWSNVILYYQRNTNVDVEVKYVLSVEFPSVTICNQNQFRYVFYLKFNFKQDCIPLVAHISQCALCWGWGCLALGGAWFQGVPGPRGCLVPGKVPSYRGECLVPGRVPASDPTVNRITDTSKKHNVAPTLLQAVTMDLYNLSLQWIFLVFILCIHSALQKLQN